MADPTKPGPNDESAAYRAMSADWQKIADIRAGADAVRAKGEKYLPRFEAEGREDYDRRRQAAPWRPEFNDALASLVAKPFAQDVGVKGAEDAAAKDFVEDVDTRGNSLTVFAREMFADGVANGVHAILVDHTPNTGARTAAEERATGARPYFVQVNVLGLIACYFGMVRGELRPVYARMREEITEREGFGEVCIKQVRELEPGIWRIYRENDKEEWVLHEEGITSLDFVPLVLFFTGERKGDFHVKPPLKDLADLQIELYQALSRQDEILNFCGFPMLSGNGFSAPKEPVTVGPRSILYAPAADSVNTSWSFVQPDAANIKEVRDHVSSITADMRRLGMQPMAQKAGGITATATSVDTAKAHSVLQAWVIGFKDALEQAFVIVDLYRKRESKVEVAISTDFSVEPFAQAPLTALREARKSKDISWRTYVDGLRRFDVLPADFDPEAEELAIAEEMEGLEPEEPIDPASGGAADDGMDVSDDDLRTLFSPDLLAGAV